MKTVTLENVIILSQTEKAIKATYAMPAPKENFGFECVWIPKSQITINNPVSAANDGQEFTKDWIEANVDMPSWLSQKLITQIHDSKSHYAK